MCVPSLVLIARAVFPLEREHTYKVTNTHTDHRTYPRLGYHRRG